MFFQPYQCSTEQNNYKQTSAEFVLKLLSLFLYLNRSLYKVHRIVSDIQGRCKKNSMQNSESTFDQSSTYIVSYSLVLKAYSFKTLNSKVQHLNFNSLLRVCKSDETPFLVFDILLTILVPIWFIIIIFGVFLPW